MHIAFIGLGLIGGSLAKAIRKYHPTYRLSACEQNQEALEAALADKVIDEIYRADDGRFALCDMIFLCAPVQINMTYLPFLKSIIKKDCILTDVGSVKEIMMEASKKEGLSAQFIGGHPMAGSEKTGYENASDFLLENAYCFLTPGEKVPQEMTNQYVTLLRSIRAIPLILSGKEHDFIVAGVSHLPHLVASSLVNLVHRLDTPDEKMRQVAAGGFRDITRIASSSPVMWEQICLTNRKEISYVLGQYISILSDVQKKIDSGDGTAIRDMFTSSRDYRDSLNDNLNGSVSRQYTLYVDIYDEPGGIATITTLLAMRSISIKNIGILHNREFEEGILRIEFYTEDALKNAEITLKNKNYIVRKRT